MGEAESRARRDAERVSEVATYRVAYEQSVRALDDQADELGGMRVRGGQYLAFVGAATAFLVGSGLGSQHRGTPWFFVLAGLASLLSLLAIGSVIYMLRPATWQFQLDAKVLIDRWIERDVPKPTEQELLRALALRQSEMRVSNELVLRKIRAAYMSALIAGGLGILVWAAVVWAYR